MTGGGDVRAPRIYPVTSGRLDQSPDLLRLVDEVRADADAFVFVSGGASNVDEALRLRLIALFDALAILADRGCRIGVGDGGMHSGVMEAVGLARVRSRLPFPLIGVAPAAEIAGSRPGTTRIDPNHSHVLAVDNPGWVETARRGDWDPANGYWGLELEAMADLFDCLSRGRPSVAIVANGGRVTLDEVRMHLDSHRKTILVAGSGRAADALVSLIRGTTPGDDEILAMMGAARAAGTLSAPALCEVVDLFDGSPALADRLARHLACG